MFTHLIVIKFVLSATWTENRLIMTLMIIQIIFAENLKNMEKKNI